MSAPPTGTLIHYIDQPNNERAVCGAKLYVDNCTGAFGVVTCFACRRTPQFKAAQLGGGGPTPLAQVMAESPQLQVLHRAGLAHIVKRGLNSGSNDGEHEALTELADALGLVYDEDTETYH